MKPIPWTLKARRAGDLAAGGWLMRSHLIHPAEVAGTLFRAANAFFVTAATAALSRVEASRFAERMPWWFNAMTPIAALASLVAYIFLVRRCSRLTVACIVTGLALSGLAAAAVAGWGHGVVGTPMVTVALTLLVHRSLMVPLGVHAAAMAMNV